MNLSPLLSSVVLLALLTSPVVKADILECPVAQTAVAADAKPDIELFKLLVRCNKGEKPVPAGSEGAVTVEVSALKVAAPRPWSYRQDAGSGQEGTMVYPVKATYTVRTHYRAATEVEADWIRILNFYVDGFGEWRIGSEEPVKSPSSSRIPVG